MGVKGTEVDSNYPGQHSRLVRDRICRNVFTGPGGRVPAPVEAQAFVMVGVCGGFTTFSAFSLQTLELARAGRLLDAGANVVLSFVLCLGAVILGHWLATLFGRA